MDDNAITGAYPKRRVPILPWRKRDRSADAASDYSRTWRTRDQRPGRVQIYPKSRPTALESDDDMMEDSRPTADHGSDPAHG